MNIKRILLGLVVLLVVIQFFGIDKSNPEVDIQKDFLEITKPDLEIETIIRSACYDCHSHQTVYPWYTSIAPFSWWIKHHIDEGKEHLNFSNWSDYDLEKQDHKLDELYEEVEEGEMPLNSYTWMHSEANLTEDQKSKLIEWAKELRKSLK